MRRNSILVAATVAVVFVCLAKTGWCQSQNPSTAQGATKPAATPPAWLPPNGVRPAPIQPVTLQQEVEVPAVLSGGGDQTAGPPTAPPSGVMPPASLAPATPTQQDGSFQPAATPPASAADTFPRASSPPAMPLQLQSGGATAQAGERTAAAPNWLRSQPIGTVEQSAPPAVTAGQGEIQPASVTINDTTTDGPRLSPPGTTVSGGDLIATDGPRLRVSSQSPGKISLGKSSRFEVVVENLENRRAENVILGINLPEWVEIQSTQPTTGSHEPGSGEGSSRIVWQIPIVESSSTEKMVLNVTPREPRAFDLQIEWTFRPIKGKTTIEVTQPQLLVQMTGPAEVQYGEMALYHVTVSNPGTGAAENVTVMLPEVLGGERAALGNIEPQQQKQFQVELIARTAGPLELVTTVIADTELSESVTREIMVRRAALDVQVAGPPMKYAGTNGTYQVVIANSGDAIARDVMAAVAIPSGLQYVGGIEGAEQIDGGIRWNVGMLSPGNQRTYQIECAMVAAGEIHFEAAARGNGDLAATGKVITRVDAVADLVLTVEDPKGPLPVGQPLAYKITIRNRGTRSARGVDIVMHFSEGVEPSQAEGLNHELSPGQITFSPIAQIDPGQEIVLKVIATASQPGSHRFRAQLLCEESDSHEVAEGTTKFFGEGSGVTGTDAALESAGAPDNNQDFRR